ncbi:dihydropyrimidinase [Meiothermus granaticius]|uniref:D-hydantoinase n=1 Tax=Meiothermus granaticius NBRC 107808 TaxID=1227551 RepID=A0A399FAQ3_9DEIN|nr:dihydropyrimidinase [Meiothermus granaticius]MCL6526996.1 dihydropyrimidinase [Thermaceae bacterium]RIH92776.1 D-hydantoinase [Meiothermus granaticius NBRC 107808]GEM87355.1 dihydropyrimidinase [Meiothermus granaticius NBRC 107808]
MALLIKNGEIITADSRYKADIYVEGETITRIGQSLEAPPGTEVIDASGQYVFPGFIDPHVHIYLPFMATFAKDTHETGSKAALMGGTTTYIEMCAPSRHEDTLEGYQLWKGKAEGNSYCDYTFHMAVTRFDDKTAAQLREIVKDGINSFKIFLSYKGFFGVDDGEMYQTLRLAKELGVIVTAHCENAELVGQLQQKLLSEGKTGPEWHEPSRPESVEAEGTARFATFLENTGATGYVVHLSCKPALDAAMDAKARGVPLFIESVIPHFLLDKTYAERGGVEAMKYIMSPPLRDKRNQKALWDALAMGFIDTVGTDHCPFDTAQKLLGKDAFTAIPNGIPAIEDRVNLLYTYGVSRGNLDIHRFVDAASTKSAKLFGLFPRKGTIAVGSDADLVIYDPSYRGKISAATQSVNNDYNGFEGFEIDGKPRVVTVRGKVAVRDGQFVGEKGRGKLLRREPMYF